MIPLINAFHALQATQRMVEKANAELKPGESNNELTRWLLVALAIQVAVTVAVIVFVIYSIVEVKG